MPPLSYIDHPLLKVPASVSRVVIPEGSLDVVSLTGWPHPDVAAGTPSYSNDPPNWDWTTDGFKSLPRPAAHLVSNLSHSLDSALANNAQSIQMGTDPARYPLSVFTIWAALSHLVIPSIEKWTDALAWLHQQPYTPARERLLQDLLPKFAWQSPNHDVDALAGLLSRNWLPGKYVTLIMARLVQSLPSDTADLFFVATNVDWFNIQTAYESRMDVTSAKGARYHRVLQQLLSRLGDRDLGGVFGTGDHWIAYCTLRASYQIAVGDSTSLPAPDTPIPKRLRAILAWLMDLRPLAQSKTGKPVVVPMDISFQDLQHDSFSCGVLAPDALHQHLLGRTHPGHGRKLVGNSKTERDATRVELLADIVSSSLYPEKPDARPGPQPKVKPKSTGPPNALNARKASDKPQPRHSPPPNAPNARKRSDKPQPQHSLPLPEAPDTRPKPPNSSSPVTKPSAKRPKKVVIPRRVESDDSDDTSVVASGSPSPSHDPAATSDRRTPLWKLADMDHNCDSWRSHHRSRHLDRTAAAAHRLQELKAKIAQREAERHAIAVEMTRAEKAVRKEATGGHRSAI
ncbi:hypothetical protein DFH09DRAFT_1302593 [Mycena vulgaris]|nr:hypothetical protein DFH09DRAFT_1302593 [Mycena vulgaris]